MDHEILWSDPQSLFDKLVEHYPVTGAEYIAVLRGQGFTDNQIAIDYIEHVKPAPTMAAADIAMKKRMWDFASAE